MTGYSVNLNGYQGYAAGIKTKISKPLPKCCQDQQACCQEKQNCCLNNNQQPQSKFNVCC